jgi:acyl carrier protein
VVRCRLMTFLPSNLPTDHAVNTASTFIDIVNIIAKLPECRAKPSEMTEATRLREDLGLESIAMIDLIVAIEDHFHVYFDPITMNLDEAFRTIGTLNALVDTLIAKDA